MFDRLDQLEARYNELTATLASPELASDQARYQKSAKAHSDLTPVVERYREYKDLKRGIAESRAVIAEESDAAMRAYAQEELAKLEARLTQVEQEIKVLLHLPEARFELGQFFVGVGAHGGVAFLGDDGAALGDAALQVLVLAIALDHRRQVAVRLGGLLIARLIGGELRRGQRCRQLLVAGFELVESVEHESSCQ